MTPLQKAAQAVINRWAKIRYVMQNEISALRKALADELQQSVEPFAYISKEGIVLTPCETLPDDVPLYLHPPQQAKQVQPSDDLTLVYMVGLEKGKALRAKQVPMTDDQISQMRDEAHDDTTPRMLPHVLARAIEAHHGIGGQP